MPESDTVINIPGVGNVNVSSLMTSATGMQQKTNELVEKTGAHSAVQAVTGVNPNLVIGGVAVTILVGGYFIYKGVKDFKDKLPKIEVPKTNAAASAAYTAATVAVNNSIAHNVTTTAATAAILAPTVQIAQESLDAIIARDWQTAYNLIYQLTLQLYDAKIANNRSQISIQNTRITNANREVTKITEDRAQNTTNKVLLGIVTLGIGAAVMDQDDLKRIEAAKKTAADISKDANSKIATFQREIQQWEQEKQNFAAKRGSLYTGAANTYASSRRNGMDNNAATTTTRNQVSRAVG